MVKNCPVRIILVLLTVFIFLFSTGEIRAEEKKPEVKGTKTTADGAITDDNVFTLGEIEVRGKSDTNKNTTVEKVTGDEMQEFNRNRLTDALDLKPGITVSSGGTRNEQSVSVRGFDKYRVPTFLDGIPIYVPYDRTFDYSRFTTFDLSEIVVSKGFTSVLYGPNTMGGAVNMITKRPSKLFESTVGAGYSTGNTYYGYANVGTNQKKWYLQAGASYFNSDFYPMSNDYTPTTKQGGGRRIQSDSKDSKVSFKVALTPAEGHEYAFGFSSQQGEKGGPPDTRPDGSPNVRFSYWTWPRWDKDSYYVLTNTPLGDKSYVKTRLYYDKFENWLDFFNDKTYSTYNRGFGERSYYDDNTIGGTIEAGTKLIPRNNIKAAFHYKRDTHKEHNRLYREGAVFVPEPWQTSSDVTTSTGIEDTIDITKKFYAIAGISYDTNEGLRATEWTTRVATRWVHFDTALVSSWNPQLGLFYRLSDKAKLHASVAKKTRFPSMKEKFTGGFGTMIANPDLKPEKSINYEVGYEDVFFDNIGFKTNVFHNDINDMIQKVTVDAAGNGQNQNIGKVKQYGIEIEGFASITADLECGANYTYLNRTNETDTDQNNPKYIRLTDSPAHKVFGYVKYMTPLKGLSVLGSVDYISGRTSSDDGMYNTGASARVNMKASYKIKEGLTIDAGVNNVLDRCYMYTAGYPEPGRTWFAGITYRFGK